MNTPSPFIPQGSFLERKRFVNRSKVKWVVLIVLGFHAAALGVMLVQGCRHSQEKDAGVNHSAALNSTAGPSGLPANAPALAESTLTNPPTFLVSSQIPAPSARTEAAPPAQPAATQDYRVAKGDTLGQIAKRHGVSLSALSQANPGVDPAKLQIGQTLRVPESAHSPSPSNPAAASRKIASSDRIHLVKNGESLSKVARAHRATVKALRDLNHLTSDQLVAGQKLKLPPQTPPKPITLNAAPANSSQNP